MRKRCTPGSTIPLLLLATGLLWANTVTEAGIKSFLTTRNPGAVIVLDDGEVVASLDLGDVNPYAVAVTRDGSRLYVTDWEDSTLSVIDGEALELIATIPTGAGPVNVALNSSGTRAYVANLNDSTVSIIDTETLGTLHTTPMLHESEPNALIVSPDDAFLYVALKNNQTPPHNLVVKLHAVNASLIADLELPPASWPESLALSPDGGKLYIGLRVAEEIQVVDTASFEPIIRVPVAYGPTWMAMHPDGDRLYVSCWLEDAVLTVDANSLATLHTLTTIRFPTGLDVTPDGTQVHLLEDIGDQAYILDVATNSIVQTIDVGGWSSGYGNFIPRDLPPDDEVPAVSRSGALVLTALMLALLASWTLRRRGRTDLLSDN